ncbi:MAG TPA: UDP-4-amino-4,6-dideoxy-N-acetyl-beta-L-altrosamine transaminase [Nitrospirae bacterium]|nr:UDP-4-amino-4,6-dideoxy-N-acetyl-beta-L-altrosamine transaminase [Nitrospirota bacterium]
MTINGPKDKLLITGISGLLGNNLACYFKDKYEVFGLYNSHPVTIKGIRTGSCNMLHKDAVEQSISEFDPSVIIHCASLTNVDTCETDKELADSLNVRATRYLTECAVGRDIKLIYISTDSVYDGTDGNFSEDAPTNPLNYYGLSKLEGEREIKKNKNSLILRTNIFGWNIQEKNSLGEWILSELQAGREIKCFKDVFFSSIYTLELARIIDIAIRKDLTGTYNCGASDSCSKYEFAQKIADRFNLDRTLINPISIDNFKFTANRGKQLSLDVNKLENTLDYKLPSIDQSIDAFYKDFRCGLNTYIRENSYESSKPASLIPYGTQYIDKNDIKAVVDVLRSDRLTQGPKINDFENALAEYCGAKYAVAVNSGTSALHIACLAAGVKENDEVITSPNTFVASANCAVYCGAKPIFGDIDTDTYNILPEEIDRKITAQTRAVVPVHFAGQSCDMETISSIVKMKEKEFNSRIVIIEDSCHALGSLYKDKLAGSCFYSDMVVMSFHPVKHITTGEGGIVLTNNDSLYRKLVRLRSHGITNTPGEFIYNEQALSSTADNKDPEVNPWYYEQVDLGHNYRITDIQCALGLSQFSKLRFFRERRREIVNRYNSAFRDIGSIQVPYESKECDSNFHLYVLLFDFKKIGTDRASFMHELKNAGIQTQVHYIPVHTQPFYQMNFGTSWGDCPNAEKYYQRCLSMPLHPSMSNSDVEKVISKVRGMTEGVK